MQTLVLGLENFKTDFYIDAKIPIIRAVWQISEHEKISLLTDTISKALKQIAQENSGYIKILTEENYVKEI